MKHTLENDTYSTLKRVDLWSQTAKWCIAKQIRIALRKNPQQNLDELSGLFPELENIYDKDNIVIYLNSKEKDINCALQKFILKNAIKDLEDIKNLRFIPSMEQIKEEIRGNDNYKVINKEIDPLLQDADFTVDLLADKFQLKIQEEKQNGQLETVLRLSQWLQDFASIYCPHKLREYKTLDAAKLDAAKLGAIGTTTFNVTLDQIANNLGPDTQTKFYAKNRPSWIYYQKEKLPCQRLDQSNNSDPVFENFKQSAVKFIDNAVERYRAQLNAQPWYRAKSASDKYEERFQHIVTLLNNLKSLDTYDDVLNEIDNCRNNIRSSHRENWTAKIGFASFKTDSRLARELDRAYSDLQAEKICGIGLSLSPV